MKVQLSAERGLWANCPLTFTRRYAPFETVRPSVSRAGTDIDGLSGFRDQIPLVEYEPAKFRGKYAAILPWINLCGMANATFIRMSISSDHNNRGIFSLKSERLHDPQAIAKQDNEHGS